MYNTSNKSNSKPQPTLGGLNMSTKFSFDRYLNIRSAHTPVWLNGGQKVAFLTDITGTPQVWSVDRSGGWPEQLTFFTEKVWTLNSGYPRLWFVMIEPSFARIPTQYF